MARQVLCQVNRSVAAPVPLAPERQHPVACSRFSSFGSTRAKASRLVLHRLGEVFRAAAAHGTNDKAWLGSVDAAKIALSDLGFGVVRLAFSRSHNR
jgi:hypothetical protein